MNKKGFILPAVGALFAAGIYYFLKGKYDEPKENSFQRIIAKAGHPDQLEGTEIDELENAKMVSEGSQFGVQYFNEIAEMDDELFKNHQK